MVDEFLKKTIEQARSREEATHAPAFEALRERYAPLLHATVSKFSGQLPSHEEEDLLQEADIALFRAIERFDSEREGITFGLYLKICLEHRFISLLRKEKRRPKTVRRDPEALRDIPPTGENLGYRPRSAEERGFVRLVRLFGADYKRHTASCDALMARLTPFEKSVFEAFIAGESYREIAAARQVNEKAVDNALSRIRAKAGTLREPPS